MHSSVAFTIFIALISFVNSEYENSDKIDYPYVKNPWKPVLGPYGNRVKPLKTNPKYDEKYFIHSAVGKPYVPTPYVSGLYTVPYYAYGEVSPVYQPVFNPYPSYINGNYYVRKGSKDKPYVPLYKD